MKRLLYIAHRLPYPPDKGERVRAFQEVRALSGHFRVTVAAPSPGAGDRQAVDGLARHCDKVVTVPLGLLGPWVRAGLSVLGGRSVTEGHLRSRQFRKLLLAEAEAHPFDLVVAYSSGVLPHALALRGPRVMDLVDADSVKWAQYADDTSCPPGRWVYRREARCVAQLERMALEQCDAVVVVSAVESDALGAWHGRLAHASQGHLAPGNYEKLAGGTPASPSVCASASPSPAPAGRSAVIVSNGVDSEYFDPAAVRPAEIGPKALVFTGTMSYRPNVDAVCWFAREVWPALKRQSPDLSFVIVGRDPAAAVAALGRIEGIRVTGTVPDVRPYLAAASIVICPLRIARGIQNKVLEAMSMARPVVASGPALEGLELEAGRHALSCREASQWQSELLALLADEPRGRQLGLLARQHVRENYTWEARMAPLVDLCRRLAKA